MFLSGFRYKLLSEAEKGLKSIPPGHRAIFPKSDTNCASFLFSESIKYTIEKS